VIAVSTCARRAGIPGRNRASAGAAEVPIELTRSRAEGTIEGTAGRSAFGIVQPTRRGPSRLCRACLRIPQIVGTHAKIGSSFPRSHTQDGKDPRLQTPGTAFPEARGLEPEAPGTPLGSGSAGLGCGTRFCPRFSEIALHRPGDDDAVGTALRDNSRRACWVPASATSEPRRPRFRWQTASPARRFRSTPAGSRSSSPTCSVSAGSAAPGSPRPSAAVTASPPRASAGRPPPPSRAGGLGHRGAAAVDGDAP
jgi:hypothetical protein